MKITQADFRSRAFQEALAQDVARHFSKPPAMILIGGSTWEGFATSLSDVDLVAVVSADLSTSADVRTEFLATRFQGIACETALTTPEAFLAVVRGGPSSGQLNELDHLDHRRRLLAGFPILGADEYHSAVTQVERAQLARDISLYSLGRANSYFEDVLGLATGGRFDEAFMAARTYFENCCDATLAATGDLYFRSKWRYARVKRTFLAHAGLRDVTDLTTQCLMGTMGCSEDSSARVRVYCRLALWLMIVTHFPEILRCQAPKSLALEADRASTRANTLVALFPSRTDGLVVRCGERAFQVTRKLALAIAVKALCGQSDLDAEACLLAGVDSGICAQASKFVNGLSNDETLMRHS